MRESDLGGSFRVGLLVVFIIAAGLTLAHDGIEMAYGPADLAMLGGFIMLMVWLLSPRKKRLHD